MAREPISPGISPKVRAGLVTIGAAATLLAALVAPATIPLASDETTGERELATKFDAEQHRYAHLRFLGWSSDRESFDFEISNDNPFPIHDPSIRCNIKAPSGTVLGRATATAYEIVPAGGKKAISDLRMEFYDAETLLRARFPAQAQTADCWLGQFQSIVELDRKQLKAGSN